MHTVTDAMLNGPDHAFTKDRGFVLSTPESLPTPQSRDLCHRICEIFFRHEDIAQLPALLSTRNSPVRRNELTNYFRAFHIRALDAVLTAMEEHNLMPPRPVDDPLRALSTLPVPCKAMVEYINALDLEHPDEPDAAEIASAAANFAATELDLACAYNGVWLKSGPAYRTIAYEFPSRHVSQLEQLLYADWYTACFVVNPMQAAMWGNYGDEHKGVCLKFKAYPSAGGKPSIKLKRINGWHSGESADSPTYGYVEHEFLKVEYESRFIDMDFFRSLGRLTEGMLEHWYQDAAGNISPLVSDVLSQQDRWRDQYWSNFTRAVTTKLTDWAHENEYRLTLVSNLAISFRDDSRRKLQYRFEDIQGLIFGMKTATEDKLKIIGIIEEKCRKVGRDDFEFYQAYYSHSTGKMEMAKMNLPRFK